MDIMRQKKSRRFELDELIMLREIFAECTFVRNNNKLGKKRHQALSRNPLWRD